MMTKSTTPELEDEHHLLLRNYVSMDQNSGKGESILDLIPQDLSFFFFFILRII